MDEVARAIGWLVIIIGGIYVLGKIIFALDNESEKKRQFIIYTSDIERRLAYRTIYRSTTDPAVHEHVKSQYGGWEFLYLDLNDDEYREKMLSSSASEAFKQAIRNIESHGSIHILVDGKIVSGLKQPEAK